MTLFRPRSPETRFLPLVAALAVAGMAAGCSDDGPLQWPDNGPRDDVIGTPGQDVPDARTDPGRDAVKDPAADPTPGDTGAEDTLKVDATDRDDVGTPSCPAAGAVLITELMPNPEKSDEPAGEYLEVHNPGSAPVDLAGWELRSGDSAATVEASVVVPAGGWIVLARSADGQANGGLTPAWVYTKVTMANSGADDVALACGGTVVDRVAFGPGWPLQAGRALVLDPSGLDATRNDDPRYWCAATTAFGAGDLGSPGQANAACGASSCGDTVVQAWETCDDGNTDGGDACPANCGPLTPSDRDGDGVNDGADNCPDTPNALQVDTDKDGIGDACDFASCGDGKPEGTEQCDDGNKAPGDGCTAECRTESFAPGAVLISEFHYNPKAVGDTAGEWIEVHNPGTAAVDIAGWTLSDAGGDTVVLMPESKTLPVPAGGYVVVGHSAVTADNGGVAVDFAYGSKPTLNNDKDSIVLTWNGTVIDQVAYDTTAGWPKVDGASVQLDAELMDWELNDLPDAWCPTPATHALPSGDFGTPGAPNVTCGP